MGVLGGGGYNARAEADKALKEALDASNNVQAPDDRALQDALSVQRKIQDAAREASDPWSSIDRQFAAKKKSASLGNASDPSKLTIAEEQDIRRVAQLGNQIPRLADHWGFDDPAVAAQPEVSYLPTYEDAAWQETRDALEALLASCERTLEAIMFRGGANSTVTSPLTDDAGNNLFDEFGNAVEDALGDDGKHADYHGPSNTNDPGYQAHKAVHDAAEHLYAGRVTNSKAREVLRDALDHADKPATGKAKSDGAIGRALGLARSLSVC